MQKKSYIANANKLELPHLYSNPTIQIRVHEPKFIQYDANPPVSPKSPITDNKLSFETVYQNPKEPQISKVYTKSLHNYNHFVNKKNELIEKLNLV
jgi:hypothetical protein